jgi:hypothetical protein
MGSSLEEMLLRMFLYSATRLIAKSPAASLDCTRDLSIEENQQAIRPAPNRIVSNSMLFQIAQAQRHAGSLVICRTRKRP